MVRDRRQSIAPTLKHCFGSDLAWLITRHAAAQIIQVHYRRHRLYGHARRASWVLVRAHIGTTCIRLLWPFSDVRREWRSEPESWLSPLDGDTLCAIIDEAYSGLWGARLTPYGTSAF